VADLEDCGSVDNRIALARSCIDRKMYREAASLYRSCLAGVHESDPDIRFGLATALVLGAEFKEAHAVAQALRQSHPSLRSPEVRLATAKALEGLGRFDGALAEYRVLADTFAGEEGAGATARCCGAWSAVRTQARSSTACRVTRPACQSITARRRTSG
jgi:hypothetical protein